MQPNPQKLADLVLFTKEILNGNIRFLCSVTSFLMLVLLLNHDYYLLFTEVK